MGSPILTIALAQVIVVASDLTPVNFLQGGKTIHYPPQCLCHKVSTMGSIATLATPTNQAAVLMMFLWVTHASTANHHLLTQPLLPDTASLLWKARRQTSALTGERWLRGMAGVTLLLKHPPPPSLGTPPRSGANLCTSRGKLEQQCNITLCFICLKYLIICIISAVLMFELFKVLMFEIFYIHILENFEPGGKTV